MISIRHPRLSTGNVTTEDLGLEPVGTDEETVTEGEELRDVGRTPEVVGRETAGGEVTGHEGEVGDGLVGTDVGEGL
jgi:hypothetical protein